MVVNSIVTIRHFSETEKKRIHKDDRLQIAGYEDDSAKFQRPRYNETTTFNWQRIKDIATRFVPKFIKRKFKKSMFPWQGFTKQLIISPLAYTCSTAVLALHFRLLSVSYRRSSHTSFARILAAPCCTGSHLSPRYNPPHSWAETSSVCQSGAQKHSPYSTNDPAHTCPIIVLVDPKTRTRDWRFHPTQVFMKSPGSKPGFKNHWGNRKKQFTLKDISPLEPLNLGILHDRKPFSHCGREQHC